MDLVNEYLRAVSALLPKAQREDIIAELRDTLLTRIEAKQAELGRPPTDAEIEAALREVGHPLVVAARYGDGPQHVVGPTLYPYWSFAVKIAITLQIVIAVIVLLIRSIGGGFLAAFGQAAASAISGALLVIGVATAVAWVVERQGLKIGYLDQWRVRDLRMLEFAAWNLDTVRDWFASRSAGLKGGGARRDHRSWVHRSIIGSALTAVAGGTVLVLLCTGAIPLAVIGNAGDPRALGLDTGPLTGVDWPAFRQTLFWPTLAYGGFIIFRGVLGLVWPRAVWLYGLLQAASGAVVVAFCLWLWNASPIAAAIRVDRVSDFGQRMEAFRGHALVPLVPILTISVAAIAFAGALVVLTGLWRMVVGALWASEVR